MAQKIVKLVNEMRPVFTLMSNRSININSLFSFHTSKQPVIVYVCESVHMHAFVCVCVCVSHVSRLMQVRYINQ